MADQQWAKEWGNNDEYDYRGFIDWLASHKINHLNMWLFNLAFGIAYDSLRFPECVNRHHPNVKNEFISDMIEYAHKRHIEMFSAPVLEQSKGQCVKQVGFLQFN